MSYVFRIETNYDDGKVVWVTTLDYWEKFKHFSDTERGKKFPDEIKKFLGNISEACFKYHVSDQFIRRIFRQYGWKEV